MALEKTDNHPFVITQSLPPNLQLTFLSIDNDVVLVAALGNPLASSKLPQAHLSSSA